MKKSNGCLPVVALLDTTIERSTGVSETLEVLSSIFRPLGSEVRARGLVVEEVTNGILLSSVALKVNFGPGIANVLLHSDEINRELELAELVLKVNICGIGDTFDQHLDSIFEVVQVTLVRSLGQKSPSLSFSLVGNVVHVDGILVLALESTVALLVALLAELWLGRAVSSFMAGLIALTTSAGELARLSALGLGMTFLTLVDIRLGNRWRDLKTYAVEASTHLLRLGAITREVTLFGKY